MKFQKYLNDTCVPEWRPAYVDYKDLKKMIKNANVQDDNSFIRELQKELTKCQRFYLQQCSNMYGRFAYLQTQIPSEIVNSNTIRDIKHVRFLIREFHQWCLYLQNYQKLNKIAFAKILKKYDKNFSTDLKNHILHVYIDDDIFKDSKPKEYQEKSEDLITTIYQYLKLTHPQLLKTISRSNNNVPARSLAMRYVRGKGTPRDDFAFFRVGLYTGIAIVLAVMSIIKIFQNRLGFDPVWRQVLYIFGGMFIVVLSFFGISFDLYIWRKYRINYVFIFELNPKETITYKQFMELAAISFFLWSLCGYLTTFQILETYISFRYIPLILIGLYITVLFLPLPIFYYSSRKWFINTLFRIFTPGFRKVTFKDFFIANLLISLTFFWTSVYVTVCFYTSPNDGTAICRPSSSWFTPLLLCIPLIIRLIQCLRKYHDRKANKNLYNAGKYLVTIAAVFASSFNSIIGIGFTFYVWILLATASALYSYYWDVHRDWNVQGNGKIISKRALYIVSILNFFLRFNWILSINVFILFDQVAVAFGLGCLEVFRRYLWALFRMENEHTHNVENFRAITDIPLLDVGDDEEERV